MKRILIIDSSELVRQYIKGRLEQYGFEIIIAKDGFEGIIKIKNEIPDLIIMDFYLNRMNGIELLKEKNNFKASADIPVIVLSSKIDRELITRIAKYKLFRFLNKPIKIDLLIQAICDLFNLKLEIDTTPSIIDVHLNDDILFIEVASGLNREKIEILKYKILQIKEIYKININKILIILSDINFSENLGVLLEIFLDQIITTSETSLKSIKILTSSDIIKNFISVNTKYSSLQITNDFVEAIDSFGKIDVFAYGDEIDNIKKNIISQSTERDKLEEPVVLKFDSDKIKNDIIDNNLDINEKFSISVVDDDFSTLEFMETVLSSQNNYAVNTYENGKYFINDINKNIPDLLFLDLMMPEMDGFQVMQYMKESNLNIPTIVITALTHKDIVIKAQKYGIKSFISKPLKIELIIRKADEILKTDF